MPFSVRTWIGIALLVINQPVGYGAILVCNALAIEKHNPFFSYLGFGVYALSWAMLGLGLWLAGPEGIKYARRLFKKLWHFLGRKPSPQRHKDTKKECEG